MICSDEDVLGEKKNWIVKHNGDVPRHGINESIFSLSSAFFLFVMPRLDLGIQSVSYSFQSNSEHQFGF